MKMIIAIVNDTETDAVTKTLTGSKFRVTTIASTGGFLRKGQNTLLCGVEEDQLPKALDLIRKVFPSASVKGDIRCTIFVLNVAQAHQF
jgi:uncharacterized protein YaaQ